MFSTPRFFDLQPCTRVGAVSRSEVVEKLRVTAILESDANWVAYQARAFVELCEMSLNTYVVIRIVRFTIDDLRARQKAWVREAAGGPQQDQWIKKIYRDVRELRRECLGVFLPYKTNVPRIARTTRRTAVEEAEGRSDHARGAERR